MTSTVISTYLLHFNGGVLADVMTIGIRTDILHNNGGARGAGLTGGGLRVQLILSSDASASPLAFLVVSLMLPHLLLFAGAPASTLAFLLPCRILPSSSLCVVGLEGATTPHPFACHPSITAGLPLSPTDNTSGVPFFSLHLEISWPGVLYK